MLTEFGQTVRQHDPDRFFMSLFAPDEKREIIMILLAFNHELARAREVASQPMIALIRLQWWREVVEGMRKEHPLALAVQAALESDALQAQDLLSMIDAREAETDDTLPDLEAWRDYLLNSAGGVARALGRALGVAPEILPAVACAGAAYGVAGLLRNVAALAARGRCLLPEDLLGWNGLQVADVLADPRSEAVRKVVQTLAQEGEAFLLQAPDRLPRGQIAAALPAVLARRDLRVLQRYWPVPRLEGRGLGDKLAICRAGWTGRL